jgi:aspartyl-tRNA(Asn)/glutamyl-tRNA(Gln) amidotransferase subunit C
MTLDDALLDHLAHLARLYLPPEEREHLRADLTRILEYVAILDGFDAGAAPAAIGEAPRESVLRDDGIVPPLPQQAALGPAPEVLDGHFAVPTVVRRDLRAPADGG